MPNHITNRITAPWSIIKEYFVTEVTEEEREEAISELKRMIAYRTERLVKIIRQGENYHHWVSELVDLREINYTLLKYRPTFEKLVPSPPNKETGGCSGSHKDGEVCWYTWNQENWGTKWDPYSPSLYFFNSELEEVDAPEEDGYATLIFDTAWSTPTPVWDALMDKMPEDGDERPPLHIEWADEDFGYNVGEIESTSWGIHWTWYPGGSPAARDLAAIILGPQDDEDD